jgi:hypothetical protein
MRIIAGLDRAGTAKSLSKTAGIADGDKAALLGTTFIALTKASKIKITLYRIKKVITVVY